MEAGNMDKAFCNIKGVAEKQRCSTNKAKVVVVGVSFVLVVHDRSRIPCRRLLVRCCCGCCNG
jgi:hypothetical protein